MKHNYKYDKKTGEIILNYIRVKDQVAFRYNVINKIFDMGFNDATIIIDSNRCKEVFEFEELQSYMVKLGLDYRVVKIDALDRSIMGINISKLGGKSKKKSQRAYVIDIPKDKFTESFYNDWLKNFDMAIGFNRELSIDDISTEVRVDGLDAVLFNKECFGQSLYDGGEFQLLRTFIDIRDVLDKLKR